MSVAHEIQHVGGRWRLASESFGARTRAAGQNKAGVAYKDTGTTKAVSAAREVGRIMELLADERDSRDDRGLPRTPDSIRGAGRLQS